MRSLAHMRPINNIVIHCSATPNGSSLFQGQHGKPGFKTPVEVIDGWHMKRHFLRREPYLSKQNPQLRHIGYHFVIYLSGVVATGRALEEIGAHVQGFNQKSIGICMVGTDRFTIEQWQALRDLITGLRKRYPDASVKGHRDFSPDQNKNGIVEPFEWLKTCPGFDVATWLGGGMEPMSGHILGAA